MNRRQIKLVIILIITVIALVLAIIGLKNIKVDEFKPASVIFVIDSSASNQKKLSTQINTLKTICKRLDPEDHIKIIRVSEDAYLIYEGHGHATGAISKSLNEFTKYSAEEYGTAYGEGITKAINYSKNMQKENYVPAIVVIGDLENEGNAEKQINWSKLPTQIKQAQKDMPELSMTFLYAHPQKLDRVKEILSPVLGEEKLVIATEQNTDNAIKKFILAIGR